MPNSNKDAHNGARNNAAAGNKGGTKKPNIKPKAPKPRKTPAKPESGQEFEDRYLTERGIDPQTANVTSVSDNEARRMGFQRLEGIIFWGYDPSKPDEPVPLQIRYHIPPKFNGKERKFESRSGKYPEPYLIANGIIDWRKIAKNTKIPIHFSEGPTRPLAAASEEIVVIALAGTACHGIGDDLPSYLKDFVWKGRDAYIAFDSDSAHNKNVQREEVKLCDKLKRKGAKVREPIRLPSVCGPHTGLDDMKAKYGNLDVYKDLCKLAPLYGGAKDVGGEPDMLRADEVKDEKVEWLWHHRVPIKHLTGLEGNPNEGKSWISLNIAACGSRGQEPYTKKKCDPFSTVYMSIENLPATLMRRYRNMGGDLKRLHILRGVANADGSKRGISLADIAVIEKAVAKAKAKLVVVDPLQSFLGSKVDMNAANETRPVLDALVLMAERLGVAVIIVRHLAKGTTTRTIHRALGSIDITATFRSALMVGTAPDDPANRALVHIKYNESPMTDALRFAIEGNDDDHVKLVWKGKSQLTAADLAAPEGGKKKTKVDHAEDYLMEQLKDGSEKLVSELVNADFDEKTIQRAIRRLNLKRGREGKSGPWTVSLFDFASRKFTKEGRKAADAARANGHVGPTEEKSRANA